MSCPGAALAHALLAAVAAREHAQKLASAQQYM